MFEFLPLILVALLAWAILDDRPRGPKLRAYAKYTLLAALALAIASAGINWNDERQAAARGEEYQAHAAVLAKPVTWRTLVLEDLDSARADVVTSCSHQFRYKFSLSRADTVIARLSRASVFGAYPSSGAGFTMRFFDPQGFVVFSLPIPQDSLSASRDELGRATLTANRVTFAPPDCAKVQDGSSWSLEYRLPR